MDVDYFQSESIWRHVYRLNTLGTQFSTKSCRQFFLMCWILHIMYAHNFSKRRSYDRISPYLFQVKPSKQRYHRWNFVWPRQQSYPNTCQILYSSDTFPKLLNSQLTHTVIMYVLLRYIYIMYVCIHIHMHICTPLLVLYNLCMQSH